VTEREAPPDWGFYDGWFGREQVTAVDEVKAPPDSGPVQQMPAAPSDPSSVAERLPSPPVWTVNGQLRAATNNTLTFRPRRNVVPHEAGADCGRRRSAGVDDCAARPQQRRPTPVNVPQPLPASDDHDSTATPPCWTRPAAAEPTRKPDVGVTRAPISVAPQPRRSSQTNSATPADKPLSGIDVLEKVICAVGLATHAAAMSSG
jgi:hypothetical protein